MTLLNARWPGYAIEDGVLYETAGAKGDVQQWRKVERVSATAVLGLLEAERFGCGLADMPSDGVILDEEGA
jgi:hypothetical protein